MTAAVRLERAGQRRIGAADLDRRCIDTIRVLSMDAVEKARSRHPGLPTEVLRRLGFTPELVAAAARRAIEDRRRT